MNATVQIPATDLDWMMPMHAIVSDTGHIQSTGPTLAKLRDGDNLVGARFLEVFELRRPRSISCMADLMKAGRQRLQLRFRNRPDIPMKGLAFQLPDARGLFVNLSFGISTAKATNTFQLSAQDFSPTDLSIEMLYLVEAQDAVMNESSDLNMRLLGAKSAAEEQASTDTLTGLKNRRAMDIILARYVACREKFSMMHLDLDFFKAVNDTYGHAAGDFVLCEAAKIFRKELRSEDSVIRFGGDEFVLLIHRLTNPIPLAGIATRILQGLEKPMLFEGHECRVSGSIGITVSDDYDPIDPGQMLADADAALYAAKEAGRAQHRFFREVGGVGNSASNADATKPLARAG